MKQKVEIEVDVPEGWELTGEFRVPERGECYLSQHAAVCEKAFGATGKYLILRKIEPVKESAWWTVWSDGSLGSRHSSLERAAYCLKYSRGMKSECTAILRIDYEDGVPVAVALESLTVGSDQ